MNDHSTGGRSESTAEDEPAPDDRSIIRSGRHFEEELHLDADQAGRFLVDLGEQLRSGEELTIETDEWSLPFTFEEPVEVEIDFEGVDQPELEIELELRGATDADAPTVQ